MPEKLKKVVLGIAALAALALGGSALAQAGGSGGSQKSGQAEERSESGERENSAGDRDNVQDENENGEKGDHGENDRSVTGSGADQAKAAALKVTNGGKANSVERDQENGATWEVEVTKPNGKTVDVRLDQNYERVVVEGDSDRSENSR